MAVLPIRRLDACMGMLARMAAGSHDLDQCRCGDATERPGGAGR